MSDISKRDGGAEREQLRRYVNGDGMDEDEFDRALHAEARERNIYQRLALVMKDVPRIYKDGDMMGRFKFAGHDKLTEKLQPSYLKHGIHRSVSVHESTRDPNNNLTVSVFVTWTNIDDPKDQLVVTSIGSAPAMKGQPAATQEGVAVSYATKLAEFKCLSIFGSDIPDADVRPERDSTAFDELMVMVEDAEDHRDVSHVVICASKAQKAKQLSKTQGNALRTALESKRASLPAEREPGEEG